MVVVVVGVRWRGGGGGGDTGGGRLVVGWLVGWSGEGRRAARYEAVWGGWARLGAVGGSRRLGAVGWGLVQSGVTLALGRFLLVLLLLLLVEAVFIVADDRADLRSGVGRR